MILYPMFYRLIFISAAFFWYTTDLYVDLQFFPLVNIFFGGVVLDMIEDENYGLDSPILYLTPCLIAMSPEYDFVFDSELISSFYLSDFVRMTYHKINDRHFLKHGMQNWKGGGILLSRWKRKAQARELKWDFDPDLLRIHLELSTIKFLAVSIIKNFLFLIDLSGLIKLRTVFFPFSINYTFSIYDAFYNNNCFNSDSFYFFWLAVCLRMIDCFTLDDADESYNERYIAVSIIWSFIVCYIDYRVRTFFFYYF